MSPLRITYDTAVASDGHAGAGHVFRVQDETGRSVAWVSVRLTNSARAELAQRRVNRVAETPPDPEVAQALGLTPTSDVIDQALLMHAVRTLEAVLSDPDSRADLLAEGSAAWELGTADVGELSDLLEKQCRYQTSSGNDLFCTAAAPDDATVVAMQGWTRVAPTSRRLCRGCTLPDSRYLCSEFMHPQVHGRPVAEAGVIARFVGHAECDLGRPEIGQPRNCHAAGHVCWGRTVELVERFPTKLPPLALADAIDNLEVAWRLAFGRRRRLLNLRSVASTADLEQPVSSRTDFQTWVERVADVFSNMRIDEDLVPEDVDDAAARGSLNRMQTALAKELRDAESARALVEPFRQVNGLRTALTHSGRAAELPGRASALGVGWPPTDWAKAAAIIRAAVVEAARALQRQLVEIADR